MAKFGKVARTLWHETWFRGLSDQARLLLTYWQTGPRGLAVPGVVLARAAVIADDLGWSRRKFAAALAEVRHLVVVDDAAGVMFVRSALLETDNRAVDHNRPGSKNAAIGWFQSLDDVPSGIGLDNILDALTLYAEAIDGEIASVFAERLPTACARRSRGEATPSLLTITRTNTRTSTNTRTRSDAPKGRASKAVSSSPILIPEEWQPTGQHRERGAAKGIDTAAVDALATKFRNQYFGQKFHGWGAINKRFDNWIDGEKPRVGNGHSVGRAAASREYGSAAAFDLVREAEERERKAKADGIDPATINPWEEAS